jgi:hypothetical protein
MGKLLDAFQVLLDGKGDDRQRDQACQVLSATLDHIALGTRELSDQDRARDVKQAVLLELLVNLPHRALEKPPMSDDQVSSYLSARLRWRSRDRRRGDRDTLRVDLGKPLEDQPDPADLRAEDTLVEREDLATGEVYMRRLLTWVVPKVAGTLRSDARVRFVKNVQQLCGIVQSGLTIQAVAEQAVHQRRPTVRRKDFGRLVKAGCVPDRQTAMELAHRGIDWDPEVLDALPAGHSSTSGHRDMDGLARAVWKQLVHTEREAMDQRFHRCRVELYHGIDSLRASLDDESARCLKAVVFNCLSIRPKR